MEFLWILRRRGLPPSTKHVAWSGARFSGFDGIGGLLIAAFPRIPFREMGTEKGQFRAVLAWIQSRVLSSIVRCSGIGAIDASFGVRPTCILVRARCSVKSAPTEVTSTATIWSLMRWSSYASGSTSHGKHTRLVPTSLKSTMDLGTMRKAWIPSVHRLCPSQPSSVGAIASVSFASPFPASAQANQELQF